MKFPIYRLFIIGAGFSKAAGLPLGKELLELVREDVRRNFRDFGWEGPLEQAIEEWNSLYPNKPLNLERVLAYSHRKHYLRLLGSEEYFEHGSRSIAAARTAIQRILIQATPSDTPTLYRAFAERLCPNDVVLTFNYDTLLEQTPDDIGKPYTLTPEWWLKRTQVDLNQSSLTYSNSMGRLTGTTATTMTLPCAGTERKVMMCGTRIRSSDQLHQFHQSLFHATRRRYSGVTSCHESSASPITQNTFP